MTFGLTGLALALLAGSLSTLSPCVLPLVPLLVGAAAATHRLGPLALASGLALSFTAVGVFVAAAGSALGIGEGALRTGGAAILVAFGIVLLSKNLQDRFAVWASTLSARGNTAVARTSLGGLHGQFALGLLLGVVWSPCVGPTLGATITLAAQRESLGQATIVMALFGIGAAAPLVAVGLLSSRVMSRVRGRLLRTGVLGKRVLGVMLVAIGAAVLTGTDKKFEAWALDLAPEWLIDLSTRI